MRRVYRNVHIGLISAMLLAAIAFEAAAQNNVEREAETVSWSVTAR